MTAALGGSSGRSLGARAWALVVLVAVTVAAVGWLILGPSPSPSLAAWDALDTDWGTYLSERQWGAPHEAVDGNGWGLDPLEAIRRDYRYGEDGIAGLTDRDGTFNLAWALWDGSQPRVTERLFGWSNPAGDHGEEIVDLRVFGANTPTSSYAGQVMAYPHAEPTFEVTFEQARADSLSGVMRATARNTTAQAAPIDLVLKGWFHDPGSLVELADGGLVLHGPESVLVVVGMDLTGSQVADAKRALDENLRSGGLTGSGPGHVGALGNRLEVAAGSERAATFAWAEAASAALAEERARALLDDAEAVLLTRRTEADGIFRGEVIAHEAVYRQALMSLLWSQSLYTWDGASDYDPAWAGRVAADDVLIMPDKWEFPWLATWDSGFHAVTAALIDPQLGADQLRFLFSDRWQQPDGHLPCAEWVMSTECPPVFAWSAWRVYQAGAGAAFLEEVRPGLERLYDYWWGTLAVDTAGLFTGGFLGMDNLPRAPGRAQADASGWMAFFAEHLALIAEELGDDAGAAAYRADADRIGDAVNEHLWDEATGFYYDQSAEAGALIRTPSYSGLIPLIAGIVPPERGARLLDALRDPTQFATPYGIRSVSAQSLLYEPGYAAAGGVNSNWRGPIWVPINYLLVHALTEADPALAASIREQIVTLVEADWTATGRFHEYFNAETGEGIGADAQAGWTALVANLVVEGWPAD